MILNCFSCFLTDWQIFHLLTIGIDHTFKSKFQSKNAPMNLINILMASG
uniref:Uncharacterized protein n=1 Tax=Rhizophora mucronata TaxID=61149 RepID=A0A2P2QGL2_RHIMU